MPRRPRLMLPGVPQHLVQRGNNRQPCFTSNADMAAFIHWLREASCRYNVAVHAWVLMTNHVHLLATPAEDKCLSLMMQSVGRQYVGYFNRAYSRTGTLWEGRFKSCLVESEVYFLQCQRYIELNPVRAGLVSDPGDYHWSSYQSNAMGLPSTLRSPHPVYLKLGKSARARQASYRALFQSEQSQQLIADVRLSLNTGLVLGTDRFREEVAQLTGQPTKLLKRGPMVSQSK